MLFRSLGVKKTGCSGWAWVIDYAEAAGTGDTVFEEQGVKVFVDADSLPLIDGTTVRTPFRGWYTPDGIDMEMHGAMPDLVVPQTPEDETANHDAQLEAAVADLLKRVK